jgi:hypothetical protein
VLPVAGSIARMTIIRIAGERLGQDLERDVAIELRVARAIDLAHAAFAKFRDDFIEPDSGADLHRVSCGSTDLQPSTPAPDLVE